MQDDDPGWPLLALIPFGARLLKRRAGPAGLDGLTRLRLLLQSFAVAVVLIGVVAAFQPAGSTRRPLLAAVLLLAGLVSIAVGRVVEPKLGCGNPEALRGRYLTRLFTRIAFSEAAALLGFVGVFAAGVHWVCYAGIVISLAGFALAAPSRGNLAAEQRKMSAAGCDCDLAVALRSPPPSKEPSEPADSLRRNAERR